MTIFGDIKAIKSFYFLTGFLTLYYLGKREKEINTFFKPKPISHVVTRISVSILLEPVLGRKFHIDFESATTNTKILQLGGGETKN